MSRLARLAALYVSVLPHSALHAQTTMVNNSPYGAVSVAGPGVRLYSATLFGGYFSSPGNRVLPNTAGQTLRPDPFWGGGITGGYGYTGEKARISIVYSPFYQVRPNYLQNSFLGHGTSIRGSVTLTDRWSLHFNSTGALTELDQFLFTPATHAFQTQAAGSVADLTAAVRGGQFTGDQIAGLLTGTPLVESPANTTIFGDRLLAAQSVVSLSRRLTPRLTLSISGGGARLQSIRDKRQLAGAARPFLARSTTAGGGVSSRFQWTQRTSITAFGRAREVWSPLFRYVMPMGGLQLDSLLSKSWFAGIRASGGLQRDLGSGRNRGRYEGGGNLGFHFGRSRFVAGAGRTTFDEYGLGTSRMDRYDGSAIPPRLAGIDFQVSGSYAKLQSSLHPAVRTWMGGASATRWLSRNFSMTVQAQYASFESGLGRSRPRRAGARVALTWVLNGRPETPKDDRTSREGERAVE